MNHLFSDAQFWLWDPTWNLGENLHLTNDGESGVPKSFRLQELWGRIAGDGPYISKSAKASKIQNPNFRYIHKVLAHILFFRGDNTWYTTIRELYLLHAIINVYSINVTTILTKSLSRVANSPFRDIVIGGFITPIVEHMGIPFCEDIEHPLIGHSRCDLESLINMGIIYYDGKSYDLVVHGRSNFYLPNKKKQK